MKRNRVGLNNRQMNDDTYALRRRVMNIIYKCRHIKSDLPFVEVRITDKKGLTLGKATVGDNKTPHVSIMDYVAKSQDEALFTHVVLHELCHTYFNAPHNEKCPLMHPVVNKPLTPEKAWEVFKKYAGVQHE